MKKIYQKLVRDRIPEIITEAGKDFSIAQVQGDRLKDYAMKKLQEEVQEWEHNRLLYLQLEMMALLV